MPRNDYADAYSDPGLSPAGDTDTPNLEWEWWNDLPNGGDVGDDFIADPKNKLVKNWASVRRNAWGNKIQQIRDRLDQFKEWSEKANCCVCPEWLI